MSRFGGLRSLTLYIPRNFGAETTKLYYIGLRGEATKVGFVGRMKARRKEMGVA